MKVKPLGDRILLKQSEEKEQTNVIRDIAVGFEEVIFCCEDQETIDRLKRRLEELFGDAYINKVKFRLLREFLD